MKTPGERQTPLHSLPSPLVAVVEEDALGQRRFKHADRRTRVPCTRRRSRRPRRKCTAVFHFLFSDRQFTGLTPERRAIIYGFRLMDCAHARARAGRLRERFR